MLSGCGRRFLENDLVPQNIFFDRKYLDGGNRLLFHVHRGRQHQRLIHADVVSYGLDRVLLLARTDPHEEDRARGRKDAKEEDQRHKGDENTDEDDEHYYVRELLQQFKWDFSYFSVEIGGENIFGYLLECFAGGRNQVAGLIHESATLKTVF